MFKSIFESPTEDERGGSAVAAGGALGPGFPAAAAAAAGWQEEGHPRPEAEQLLLEPKGMLSFSQQSEVRL